MALVEHVRTLVDKFAFVVTPVAASLQGSEREGEVPEFLVESVRYSAAITLPMLVFMAIYGDVVMLVWMGSRYVNHELLILLAIGHMIPASQSPVIRVMMGLNLHGRLSVVNMVVQLGSLGLGLLAIHAAGWSLTRAALLTVIPVLISSLLIPQLACRRLGISASRYYLGSYGTPVACTLVFAAVLGLARLVVGDDPIVTLVTGGALGGAVMAPLYWRFMLSPATRRKLVDLARSTVGRKQLPDG